MAEMTAHVCAVCQGREYEREQVCGPCRKWLAQDLREIGQLYRLLPAAVSSPRNVEDAVDLSLPAVGGASAATVHDPDRLQTGQLAVAAVLDSWARDWAETRGKGERLPLPTVAVLTGWLLDRIEDECDQHPAIGEFAQEIRSLLSAIRRCIDTAVPPGVRYQAPCPRCGTETLRRHVGADWIECETCGRLWGDEDYADLVRQAIPGETLLSAAQVAVVLGVTRDAVYKRVTRGSLLPQVGPWGGRMLFAKADVEQDAGSP